MDISEGMTPEQLERHYYSCRGAWFYILGILILAGTIFVCLWMAPPYDPTVTPTAQECKCK